MMKKKGLIIAGILVVVVAACVVLYLVVKNDETKNNENPQASFGSEFVSVDEGGDLGTAKIVSKEDVGKAIGDSGSGVSDPVLSGVLTLGDVKSQTATYTFTMNNGKTAEVNVDARTYPSVEIMGDTPFRQTEPKVIEGIGDKAKFLIQPGYELLGDKQVLMVTKDATSFAIVLKQNRDEVAIDDKTARDIILKVAKVAKFEAVK